MMGNRNGNGKGLRADQFSHSGMKSSTDSYHQWREEMGAQFILTQENSVTFIFNLISI